MAHSTKPADHDKLRTFLKALAAHGIVARACDASGLSRSSAYRWRALDPEFCAAWDSAVSSANDRIEGALWDLGITGEVVPIVQAGRQAKLADGSPAFEVRRDSKALELLARLRLRALSQSEKRVTVEVGGALSLKREDLDLLPMETRAALVAALRQLHALRHGQDADRMAPALPSPEAEPIDASFEEVTPDADPYPICRPEDL